MQFVARSKGNCPGVDPNGRAFGEFISTGIRPMFMDRLEYSGYQLAPDIFRQRVLLKD